MPNSINLSHSVKEVFLYEPQQTISSKVGCGYPLASIYNNAVNISTKNSPLAGLCVYQKLSNVSEQCCHDALLADFVYRRDFTTIETTQWGIDRELVMFLSKMTKIKIHPRDGLLTDSNTGLVAYIFHNKVKSQIRLIFGGTTSGLTAGNGIRRHIKNIDNIADQWKANLDNVFGGIPACYQQAEKLIKELQQFLHMDSKYAGYTISTGGHSLGGGLAAYKDKPIQAECFNSAQLGRGLQRDLLAQHGSIENIKKAMSKISHYCVEDDIIPKMDKFFAVDHIGQVYIIPQITEKKDGFAAAHANFVKHISNIKYK